VLHLLLPALVGDVDFCMIDVSTVYEANGGMPLPFCNTLLDSVLRFLFWKLCVLILTILLYMANRCLHN
jgi:hypothetical protein